MPILLVVRPNRPTFLRVAMEHVLRLNFRSFGNDFNYAVADHRVRCLIYPQLWRDRPPDHYHVSIPLLRWLLLWLPLLLQRMFEHLQHQLQ